MVKEILMPKLGETMKEGVITKWLKEEGDQIKKGEPIVEIDIEKIVTEITAPESGILLKKIAQEGEIVPVKGIIGIIGELGEESNFTEKISEEKNKINFRDTLKEPVEDSDNGKVDKKTLPEPALTAGKEYMPPTNETEKKLREIWSEVLHIEKEIIGIKDNFFYLGGHSLKGTI